MLEDSHFYFEIFTFSWFMHAVLCLFLKTKTTHGWSGKKNFKDIKQQTDWHIHTQMDIQCRWTFFPVECKKWGIFSVGKAHCCCWENRFNIHFLCHFCILFWLWPCEGSAMESDFYFIMIHWPHVCWTIECEMFSWKVKKKIWACERNKMFHLIREF